MQSTIYSCHILMKFNFLGRFSKNAEVSNFVNICPKRTGLFHTNGRTDDRDEANSRFSQFSDSV
jgi:hypothetical protein